VSTTTLIAVFLLFFELIRRCFIEVWQLDTKFDCKSIDRTNQKKHAEL
jgi:hypothetical protein